MGSRNFEEMQQTLRNYAKYEEVYRARKTVFKIDRFEWKYTNKLKRLDFFIGKYI
jgi:uncharacterized membrane protein YgaE (UPF0421/DUF939 family)